MKYELALYAQFKNESHIIKEWIEHYISEGVEHFYLIDNGSTDNYISEIQPYLNKITLWKDNAKHKQHIMMNQYMLPKISETKWLIVCDLDEFIFSPSDSIKNFLQNVESDVGIIYLAWIMFGSSGYIDQPNNVISSFIYRKKVSSTKDNINTKYIVKSDAVIRLDIHYSIIKSHFKPLHITEITEENIDKLPLRLNHYPIQSYNWFKKVKMTRGDASNPYSDNVRNDDYFKIYDENSNIRDITLMIKYKKIGIK